MKTRKRITHTLILQVKKHLKNIAQDSDWCSFDSLPETKAIKKSIDFYEGHARASLNLIQAKANEFLKELEYIPNTNRE